jgi:hypothetical protein
LVATIGGSARASWTQPERTHETYITPSPYFALCGLSLFTQDQSQQAQVINTNIARSIQAVKYRAEGSTRIDFRGTALLPRAKGDTKIESKTSAVTIEASFDNLSPATQFGSAYLTI